VLFSFSSSPSNCGSRTFSHILIGGGTSSGPVLGSQSSETTLQIVQQPWFVGVVVAGSVLLVAAITISAVVTGVRHHRRAKAAAVASSSGRGESSLIERSRSSSITTIDPWAELAGVSTLTYGVSALVLAVTQCCANQCAALFLSCERTGLVRLRDMA